MWGLGLANLVFYLPDIVSPKIEDNFEMSIVLRFKIILNVTVRIRIVVRVRIRVKIKILTLILTVDVLLLVTF